MISKISEDIESFKTLLDSLDNKKIYEHFIFDKEAKKNYIKLLEVFKKTNSSSKYSTKDKKESLENLVGFIAKKTALFKIYENVKTSTNEIDLLLELTKPIGINIFKNCIDLSADRVFFECKNYNRKIDVTWIGKFYSLLKTSKVNLGIIFSYHCFTGTKWNDGIGLTKKIYLIDNTLIINFSIIEFELLAQDKSLLEIISDKITELKNDTCIKRFISHHPIENQIK